MFALVFDCFLSTGSPKLVGTDLAQAAIFLTFTSLGHLTLGTVDWSLVLLIRFGSVPGCWWGQNFANWLLNVPAVCTLWVAGDGELEVGASGVRLSQSIIYGKFRVLAASSIVPQFPAKTSNGAVAGIAAVDAGGGVAVVGFEQLAVRVWRNQGGFHWDEPILRAVHATAQPRLDHVAAVLTKFGVFHGVFPVATVISLALLYRRRWRSLTYLLITLSGSVVINRTAKASCTACDHTCGIRSRQS
jgi:hypothetical protein